MAGFGEKLSAIKGKQEAADVKKKQEAEQAVEAARLEREAKRSELFAEREIVMAEFAQAEQTANEAREAIAQADAFAAEQGENLDPEAKAEIDAMKVEAGEAQQQFEELKQRLDALNTEISAFEEAEREETEIAEEITQPEGTTAEGSEPQKSVSVEQQPAKGSETQNQETKEVTEAMPDDQFDSLAERFSTLQKKYKELDKKIYGELHEKLIQLREQGEKELASIIGQELVGGDGKIPDYAFKGAAEVKKIFEENQGDFQMVIEKMTQLEVPLMLRFGTLGKLKKFFTESPVLSGILKTEEETEILKKQHTRIGEEYEVTWKSLAPEFNKRYGLDDFNEELWRADQEKKKSAGRAS